MARESASAVFCERCGHPERFPPRALHQTDALSSASGGYKGSSKNGDLCGDCVVALDVFT